MDLHEKAKRFIRHHEGYQPTPYLDTSGKWTWGCGCRITDELILLCLADGDLATAGMFTLTHAQAALLFEQAFERAVGDLLAIMKNKSPEIVREVDHRVAAAREASPVGWLGDILARKRCAPVGSARFAALVAMSYQMGYKRFFAFTETWKALRANDWQAVHDHALDSQWAREEAPARAIETAEILRTNEWPGWMNDEEPIILANSATGQRARCSPELTRMLRDDRRAGPSQAKHANKRQGDSHT